MRVFSALALTVTAAFSARSAYAQPPPAPDPNAPVRVLTQRPYRGVFGGGTGRLSQLLTLGLHMGGGFDSSVFVDNRNDPNAVAPFGRRHGGFVQGSANLNYALNLDSVSFTADGGVAGTYYPVVDRPIARRYFTNVQADWRASSKSNLSGSYYMTFLPVTHLVPLPIGNDPSLGPGNPFDNTLGAQAESYRTSAASVDFNYQISRRVSTSLRYSNWRVNSPDRDHDVVTQGGSARISYSLTQSVGVYGGYRLDTGLYQPNSQTGPSVRYYTHGADFGFDFAKALSLTRKTSATFGAGMTGVSDTNQTQYTATGHATIMREIARTWRAWASYNRNVSFAQAFTEPVFSDWVNAEVSGLINRRLSFYANTGMSFGAVGLSYARTSDDNYRALYASTGVGFAISRHLNAGARYWYTRHRFDRGLNVPTDLMFQTGRHGVSGYLSSWIPLFSRSRRP